jgi:HAD superfamily hydrolase (TIGR01549 family)
MSSGAQGAQRRCARAVSFDYGHVLGGLDRAELAGRLRAFAEGHEVDERALRDARVAAYRAHDEAIARGLGHEAGWRALVGTLVAAAWSRAGLGEDTRDAAVEALWRAQPTRNLWRDVPDEAHRLLEALGARGVKMVVTSNSEGRVRELLEEVGIAHHFVAILDSGLLGFAKPDARIFLLAAERAGVAPDELVHVGDSEKADVVGARAAGLRTVRFDGFVPGAEQLPTEADHRVSTYSELRSVFGRILCAFSSDS